MDLCRSAGGAGDEVAGDAGSHDSLRKDTIGSGVLHCSCETVEAFSETSEIGCATHIPIVSGPVEGVHFIVRGSECTRREKDAGKTEMI